MANQTPEKWFLTPEERAQARALGLDAYLANKLGVSANEVQVISAKNVHTETTDGLIGHMVVRLDWHTPDHRWHMRNLRFNGELPVDMPDFPEECLTLLGGFAINRDTHYRDYSHDMYGLPLGNTVAVEPLPVEQKDTPRHDADDHVLTTV